MSKSLVLRGANCYLPLDFINDILLFPSQTAAGYDASDNWRLSVDKKSPYNKTSILFEHRMRG